MLLGLDLGTGSVKALLMEPSGTVVGEGSASCTVRSPHPGRAESRPEEWLEAAAAAVRASGAGEVEVTALGLSGQMHGVVLSDAAGTPLRPAVLWADARSAGELEAYRSLDTGLQRRLANPPATGMAGPSLLWLRDNEPGSYRAARWALSPKDWLRLRLTGEAATEPSDASATLLYDLEADGWSAEAAERLGLRLDLLPPLVASGVAAGRLLPEPAELLGLPAGLPVAAGAGDAAAAALGGGLLYSGPVQLTVGTGAQILAPGRDLSADPAGRTHLYRAAAPGYQYRMAAVQNAGLALEWVRGVLGISWEELYREAATAPPGCGGVTFLPHLTGERTPHLDPAARGAWAGLGLGSERAHFLRAALEGVAFALRAALEALEVAGTLVPELRLAGGGTATEAWRQMLADALERPLLTLPDETARNASARGAALLAGLAAGVYGSVEETLTLAPEPCGIVRPREPGLYGEAYQRYRALYPRLSGWPGD
ncbi:MAG: xylulokinase [Rubrobacter sp.]|nr:xylulokinase [Rubrobacter sp.]